MASINVTEARANLFSLVKRTGEDREPILITGKHGNAILIAEDDWKAIQETLFLVSIPGMRESIQEGMKEPASDCSSEPGW